MALRYVVRPGIGKSRPEGKDQFIPSLAVILLYGAEPDECLIVSRADKDWVRGTNIEQAHKLGLTPLRPRGDGLYTLPS